MGLYFAWLGFYNQMLVIPSIVGIFIFIYGLATAYVDSFNVAGWAQSVANFNQANFLIVFPCTTFCLGLFKYADFCCFEQQG